MIGKVTVFYEGIEHNFKNSYEWYSYTSSQNWTHHQLSNEGYLNSQKDHLHNLKGPAIIHHTGDCEGENYYFIKGKELSEKEFNIQRNLYLLNKE